MQEMELCSRVRCKYHHSSRNWNISDRVTKNILERKFQAEAPNQKWVTEVTQSRIGDVWLYLSAIKDLCQNEIIAYQTSLHNDKQLVLQTFSKAFEKEKDVTGLIVHSDQ